MSDFEARLQALRERFILQAIEEAATIERYAAEGGWLAIRDISHGIAGRAGMFGFASLTDAARALEEAIEAEEDRLQEMTKLLVSRLRDLVDVA